MMAAIRRWLVAGMLVVVPIAITWWVLSWAVNTLDQTLNILPPEWRPEAWIGFYVPGLGVLAVFVLLLLAGAIASNYFGSKIVAAWDRLLNRIPIVRSVYSSVKQVSDTLFSDNSTAFREAVLVEWPRTGMWTVAFVTGSPGADINAQIGEGFVSLYVPTTPNPSSGYFVVAAKSDCRPLQMTVDQALKYVISMGVVPPPVALTGKDQAVAISTSDTGKAPDSGD